MIIRNVLGKHGIQNPTHLTGPNVASTQTMDFDISKTGTHLGKLRKPLFSRSI